jgi:hypothetical protein
MVYTEPQYLEQLIPPSELKARNITSKTPLRSHPLSEEPHRILEIPNSDRVIKAYLQARGIEVTSKSQIRDRIHEYAKQKNMRLVFLPTK